jgi:hypothetical protein
MKKLISSIAIVAALLITPAFSPAASAGERHPEIHEAIHALEKAKKHMEEAAHDFGGHRKEALEACERAIHQLRLALESDKK